MIEFNTMEARSITCFNTGNLEFRENSSRQCWKRQLPSCPVNYTDFIFFFKVDTPVKSFRPLHCISSDIGAADTPDNHTRALQLLSTGDIETVAVALPTNPIIKVSYNQTSLSFRHFP